MTTRAMSIETIVASLLMLFCVALRIADPAAVARLRTSAFDSFVQALPRVADSTFPVRVVAIDEASLAAIGQWPWPRTRLAELARTLANAGARSVTFDIMLVEPDRLSPGELAHSLGSDESLRPLMSELAKLPSNDTRLAAAFGGAPVILGVVGDASGLRDIGKSPASFSFAGDDPLRFVPAFEAGITNLAELSRAATGIGAVNWLPTEDQIVRRAPLLVSIAGQLYPSLALETLRVAETQSTIFVKSSGGSGVSAFGQSTGIESLRVGSAIVPTDAQGEMWLRPAPSDPRRTISAHRILDGSFDRADISGRYIMIGATAAGLLDLRATALSPSVPGVEIHAQALEQILAADYLLRPAYATGLEIIFIVLFGGWVAWLIGRSGALRAAIVGASAIVAVIAVSWFAYARAGLLFDPVYPALSLAVLYLGTSLTTYVRSEADRARIRSAFSHYLAPSLVADLVRNHDKLKLGGETRTVTLLFADVRGFSRISERMAAEDLIRFVNRLFTPLTETILRNGGTIDKFMGDAVMAFWNAPTDDPDHARKACRTALQMLDDVAQLNADLMAEAETLGAVHEPIRIGIGINTGACVVGNVGSPERFDYSVLGDVVNVAARFEEATKTAGADIIIGEATAVAVAEFDIQDAGTVTLRSKDRPEKIFALLGDESSVRICKIAREPINQRGSDIPSE
ncbi:MAG: adenylate/guanylate cyclase domain-containing protein [Hyphomicrobium sp.]|nr:adenylate/guanylate cyclase domain-containing protein [Hyphomicrobium sp.]